MAPVKSGLVVRRKEAVVLLLKYLDDERVALGRREDVAEAVSEVKGLFSRAFRQDQWDWFRVFVQVGRPARSRARALSEALGRTARGLRTHDDDLARIGLETFIRAGGREVLKTYMEGPAPVENGFGFVYVLSTRPKLRVL